MSKKVPVAGPWVTDLEIEYVADAARNAWYDDWNMYNEKFEAAFAARHKVPHAISLPSCTSGLHLALAALGVGPGDEVIVPESTWIATAVPVTYVGATPVFADIDPTTWCLSAQSFEDNITARTKAVIPVDLYGGFPDFAAIRAVAERHGIPIIEDAAEAVGSAYLGQEAGTLGDVGVFSFHGSKTMTTGEGGMLITRNREIFERATMLRDQGRSPAGRKKLFNEAIGFKYRMSSLQAAFGLAQLERLDDLVAKKRQIFGWYADRLTEVPGVSLNAEPEGILNTFWMVTPVWDRSFGVSKEDVIDRMGEAGFDTRPFFYPLSSLPAFSHIVDSGTMVERNGTAYDISSRAINLPCGLALTEEQADGASKAFVAAIGA
jgi:perosamine synthetase